MLVRIWWWEYDTCLSNSSEHKLPLEKWLVKIDFLCCLKIVWFETKSSVLIFIYLRCGGGDRNPAFALLWPQWAHNSRLLCIFFPCRSFLLCNSVHYTPASNLMYTLYCIYFSIWKSQTADQKKLFLHFGFLVRHLYVTDNHRYKQVLWLCLGSTPPWLSRVPQPQNRFCFSFGKQYHANTHMNEDDT